MNHDQLTVVNERQVLSIINQNGKLLVDSRDVAEMVGKQHPHLLRDIKGYIKVMKDNPKLDSRQFFIHSTYYNSQNKEQPCYLLTRKGCDMVANKLTGEKGVLFTATYVTRFEEMEEQLTNTNKRFKVPNTFAEALRLAADLSEQNEKLAIENQVLKPKGEYFDALVERKLLTNFRDTAKEFKMKQNEFINWLLEKGYVYRDVNGKLKPYAQYVPELFQIKEGKRGKWSGTQTLITPKGRETFRLLLQQGKVV
ncbi:Rha family transcriptional regulator [Bacillus mycoides]|uniref:Rha family transcriptional regulator n=1 Tax=Bacillus mycoides TaxID=1405 RepID=UPI003F7B8DB6